MWGGNNFTFNTLTKEITPNISNTGNSVLSQWLEDCSSILNQEITYSVKTNDGIFNTSFRVPEILEGNKQIDILNTPFGKIRVWTNNGRLRFDIIINYNNAIILKYAKLEVGSVATPFSPRPYAEELAMCQRYYVKYANNLYIRGVNATTTQARGFIPLLQQLRTVPTLTISNITSGNIIYEGNIVPISSYAYYISDPCQITLTLAASQNILPQRISNISTGGSVELDAEIY